MKITFVSLHNGHFWDLSFCDVPISREQKLFCPKFSLPALNSILERHGKMVFDKNFLSTHSDDRHKTYSTRKLHLKHIHRTISVFDPLWCDFNSRKSLLSTRSARGFSLNCGNAEISSQFSRLSCRVGQLV